VPRYEAFAPTSARASKTAQAIRRTDTKAEVALRRALWALGLRYRKHADGICGKPDIVFGKARVLVFVDGDFWHGRDWPERKRKLLAGNNSRYWVAKIEANIARDVRVNEELTTAGWTVIRFWESDVLHAATAAATTVAAAVERASGPTSRASQPPAAWPAALRRP
jgi:DNA mismatch endonuclease (patch repair protein)